MNNKSTATNFHRIGNIVSKHRSNLYIREYATHHKQGPKDRDLRSRKSNCETLKHFHTLFHRSLHIAVTLNHTKPGVADRFVNDIKTVAQRLMKNPGIKAEGKVRG